MGSILFYSSVQSLSCVWLFAIPWTAAHQASLSIINPQNSCPSSRWCHLTISSSVIPFSSCLQTFPASGSFSMSQFFASGGQSIRATASASVLPMSIQDWFPLGLTGLISLQSKGLSRVFSNSTVQKHQFFGAQLCHMVFLPMACSGSSVLITGPPRSPYVHVCVFSHVWPFATLWTVGHQTPLSMGFFRPEYWSGLLFPPPRDLPDPGIEPASPVSAALQADCLPAEPSGKPEVPIGVV